MGIALGLLDDAQVGVAVAHLQYSLDLLSELRVERRASDISPVPDPAGC